MGASIRYELSAVRAEAVWRPRLSRHAQPAAWCFVAAGIVAVCGWADRWTSDDALITFRVARQIAAGHGPVFNAGERVEASTSALWTWLLAACALFGLDIAWTAVVLGIGLSTFAAVLITVVGYRRAVGRRSDGTLLPLGALLILPMQAFWQFSTSGMETSLAFAWVALSWWRLERTTTTKLPPWKESAGVAVMGLGTLVRPELGIVTVVFLCASIGRGLWSARSARLLAIGLSPSLSYEVFRAGYYGVLVPNTALAKSAGGSSWAKGFVYVFDLVYVYQLWIPLCAIVWLAVRRRGALVEGMREPAVWAPLTAGALTLLYVVRVGGDFMHARLLLPPLLLLLLPIWAVRLPRDRSARLAFIVVAAWALACGATLRSPYLHGNWRGIDDERGGWARVTHSHHPVSVADHLFAARSEVAVMSSALEHDSPVLVYRVDGDWILTIHETLLGSNRPPVLATEVLGAGGFVVPLDHRVDDVRGLADPLTAHLTIESRGRPGHERWTPQAWLYARELAPGAPTPGATPEEVQAARAALSCGDVRELMDSVSQPLTPKRFLSNLVGSWQRTRLHIPVDPASARREFC